MAVLFVRELFAGAGKRGTAFVKTIGVVNLFATGLKQEDIIERPVRGWKRYEGILFRYPSLSILVLLCWRGSRRRLSTVQ